LRKGKWYFLKQNEKIADDEVILIVDYNIKTSLLILMMLPKFLWKTIGYWKGYQEI
jgi:hypothetical protein